MSTQEYMDIRQHVDLKPLFLAVLWHDIWRTEREPLNIFCLMRDISMEGLGAARKFKKYAKKYQLDEALFHKTSYVIRKHSLIQIMPLRTWEAKILADIDALDGLSLDRLYLLEKKYLFNQPANTMYLWMARFALKLFVKNKTEKSFFFTWSKRKYLKMKKDFLTKATVEINEYEQLVKIAKKHEQEQFEDYLGFMREKYLNKPEEERLEHPF
jgi:hypothetical protein